MNPLVSLNLLLYRPGKYLKPCLESIFNQTYPNLEILIIDNNSADGTKEKIEEFLRGRRGKNNQAVRLIINQKNLGFAAGHNIGIKESRGEFVFLVNQDIILKEDFLSRAIEIFLENDKVAALQGKIRRLKIKAEEIEKTEIIDTTGLVILKNRRIIARGQGQKDIGQFDETEEIFGADGALPVYRKKALEDAKIIIGNQEEYFDNCFLAYKEDVDLAWRLRLLGWQAFYEPRALAWHARTAGESAAISYFGIIKERLKISQFAKYLSFKNQRLMQIKNELPRLLLLHIFWWLPKEIAAWLYVIFFEHYTWRAIKDFFKEMPLAWQKRQLIMEKRKTSAKEMAKWFK